MKIGRRLAIKLLNASKFAFGMGVTEAHIVAGETGSGESGAAVITEPLDRSVLAQLRDVVAQATEHFENYDYARALGVVEHFFWEFTDDYVELVKDRAYGSHGEAAQASVRATMATVLDKLLRLFAPIMPFAADEVWRWWRSGSVHGAAWPQAGDLDAVAGDPTILGSVSEALSGLRRAKSDAKVKQRTEILSGRVTGPATELGHVEAALSDLQAATKARSLDLISEGEAAQEIEVSDVVLAEAEQPA